MAEKLVIRINNLKNREPEEIKPPEVVEYMWGRIIAALMGFLAIMILGTWAVLALISETPAPTQSESTVENLSPQAATPAVTVAAKTDTAPDTEIPAALTPKVPPIEAPVPQADLPVADSAAVPPAATEPAPLSAPTPAPQLPAAAAFVDPIKIHSDTMIAVQLTRQLKDRRPTDKLGDKISMDGEKLIRVYLFTELQGLKGQTVRHIWRLNGKQMASVKVPVKSETGLFSSSKFIDTHMTGQWHVEVRTRDDELLAEAHFEVQP